MKTEYTVAINGVRIKVAAHSPQHAALLAVGETVQEVDALLGLDVSQTVSVTDMRNLLQINLHVTCTRRVDHG